jgi:hypothetical protein
MDLSSLFGSNSVNPLAVVERVFQEVVDQLAGTEGFTASDGRPPEELIAVALGGRLARMIVDDQSLGGRSVTGPTARHHPGPVLDPAVDDVTFNELVDRNLALAAALGACDCWGQQPDCPICDGVGGPGWLPPDRHLFAAYVYPAMRAVARNGGPPARAARRNNHHQEEKDHVRHNAG